MGIFVAILALFVAIGFYQVKPVHAYGKYTKIADYSIKKPWWTQGATMTKDYYIFTESQLEKYVGKNPSTKLVRCKRSNPHSCVKSKSYKWGHILTLLHKWDTDYFLVRSDYGVNSACWSVSQFKKVSMNNCSWRDNGTPRSRMRDYGGKNGYANQGKYYLRVYGTHNTGNLHIVLYDSSKKKKNKHYTKIHDIKLPSSMWELEDIMIDHDTGTVYFTSVHAGKQRKYQLNKLEDSTISKYIKPLGASTSTDPSGSQNSGGSEGSHTPISFPEKEEGGPIETTFFGSVGNSGDGCGVFSILNLIIDILSIGIGIVGVIGITIVGIEYMSAKGNSERTTKAKRRMFEIIVGLVIYALLWSILNFLLPGGSFNKSGCATANEQNNELIV